LLDREAARRRVPGRALGVPVLTELSVGGLIAALAIVLLVVAARLEKL
jgi:hypothetical protein